MSNGNDTGVPMAPEQFDTLKALAEQLEGTRLDLTSVGIPASVSALVDYDPNGSAMITTSSFEATPMIMIDCGFDAFRVEAKRDSVVLRAILDRITENDKASPAIRATAQELIDLIDRS